MSKDDPLFSNLNRKEFLKMGTALASLSLFPEIQAGKAPKPSGLKPKKALEVV